MIRCQFKLLTYAGRLSMNKLFIMYIPQARRLIPIENQLRCQWNANMKHEYDPSRIEQIQNFMQSRLILQDKVIDQTLTNLGST